MNVTDPTTSKKAWAKAIAPAASEFALTLLPVLSGHLPEGLRGSLYRNGPGRLERGGMSMGHWFDGDGAILAVHFGAQGATGVYRYVNTAAYLAEAEAGELLYGNYGMTAPGPFSNQWTRPLKNAANTSVLALPDKLLALWEGGKPHALDLQTLKTLGPDDLGKLEGDLGYSAHPKRDPHTGDIFNFGVSPGLNATLHLYRSDRSGQIRQRGAIVLKGNPLIHDFALAGRYLMFCISPVRLSVFPVLTGLSSFSDALEWRPELGTQILVINRETLTEVSRGEAEPWYQWHFGNGFEDADGNVVLDIIRYADFQTNQYLKEVLTGQTHTAAKGTLWRLSLDPQTGRVKAMEEMLSRSCEFPVVPSPQVGQADSPTYLSIHRVGTDITEEVFGAIARFDPQTVTLTEADLGENRYPMEPIYAPDILAPSQGWVITVVFDGNTNTSEVWVFEGDRLDQEPVCRLGLPSVVPLGFHGTWKSTNP